MVTATHCHDWAVQVATGSLVSAECAQFAQLMRQCHQLTSCCLLDLAWVLEGRYKCIVAIATVREQLGSRRKRAVARDGVAR